MSKRLIRVTDLKYVEGDDGPIVRLVGRGRDEEKYRRNIYGTKPVFWVPEDDFVPNLEEIEGVKEGYTSYDGEPLKRIHTTLPKHTGNIREEFSSHYEADVPYVRRSSVDYGLSGYIRVPRHKTDVHIDQIETDIEEENVESIEPRVMMADIEAIPLMDGTSFSDYTDEAPEPIIMITAYDSYEEEYHAIAIDEEYKSEKPHIDPKWVREELEGHWEGHDLEDQMTRCDISYTPCEDEEELLQEFVDYVSDTRPDLLSGWNWTDFDIQYLVNRLDKFDNVNEHKMAEIGYTGGYKKRRLIDGVPSFDMMRAFCGKMSYGEWRSEALDYVSQEELEVGKVEDISITEAFDDDRSKLLAYNIIDVQLCVGLDDKHGIHEFFYQMSDICGIQIYETMSEMRLVEGFILSRRDKDEILPTTEEKELSEITGGLVLNPSDGLREWVAVLDLKSLYPSSIISCNISQETRTDTEDADVVVPDMPLNEDRVPGNSITEDDIGWDPTKGAFGFTLTKEGIMPKYVKMLFKSRAEMKSIRDEFPPESERYEVWDNKQYAIKVVMNSFFGVSDNPYFRLSGEGMGGSVTGSSRYVTWKGVQIAEEMGYEVAYGDTDSIMIELANPDEDITKEEVVKRGEELEEAINDEMNQVADDFGLPDDHPFIGEDLHGTSQHCWQFEFEKLFRRFIQTGSKKRYAGLKLWNEGQYLEEPKLDVTGYEAERTDIPELTSEFQEEVIKKVLGGKKFEEVSKYFQKVIGGLESGETDIRKIGMPGVLNKPPEDYPNRPIPRGCIYANNHLGEVNWQEGDEPWVFYVKDTPPMMPSTDVLAVPWTTEGLPEGFELDIQQHIDRHIKQPLKPFLNEMGWDFSELKRGKRSQSTGSFDSTDNPFESDDDNQEVEGSDGGVMEW